MVQRGLDAPALTTDVPRETRASEQEYQALAVLSGYGYAPAFDDILAASKDPRLHESWTAA